MYCRHIGRYSVACCLDTYNNARSPVAGTRQIRSAKHINCYTSQRYASTSSLLHSPQPAAKTSNTAPPRRLLYENDNFLSGSAAMYMESLYQEWKKNPASVNPSWDRLFSTTNLEDFEQPLMQSAIHVLPTSSSNPLEIRQSLDDCGRLTWMIKSFEDRGHLFAKIDPLEFEDIDPIQRAPSRKLRGQLRLDLAYFGFTAADAERVVRVGFQDEVGGVLNTSSPPMTIGQLHELLKTQYCNKIGFELGYVVDVHEMRFLRSQIEIDDPNSTLHRKIAKDEKLRILDLIASAVHFEDFFKRKFATQKRFGCDGAESMILGLRALLEKSATLGVEHLNLGMAHRGRLNTLYHIIGKPFEVILKEFTGITGGELLPFQMQSDVKYHLGARASLELFSGRKLETELMCNPSHLEAVDPLNHGYTRAMQRDVGEDGVRKILPIQIHGDASFTGQGVVFESMAINSVDEYSAGGTMRVVCNNQIGFTTDPCYSRSSIYCTNLGRVFECPVIHVNGDSLEDVVRVFEFAAEYRARFHKSVVIDLVCYRRYGHNENDDPSITQPVMYDRIRSIPDVFGKYCDQLIKENVITAREATAKAVAEKEKFSAYLKSSSSSSSSLPPVNYAQYLKQSIPAKWQAMKHSDELGNVTLYPTNTTPEQVQVILNALKTIPEGFQIHGKLKSVLERRNESIETGQGIDWGTAEVLAFGSLLLDGHPVRVMGEDVERGTFSQRHAVLIDQQTGSSYTPLCHLREDQGNFGVSNGPLSEFGMLGYAAGYALYDPNALVMWEAQYGDFADGGTIVFDQFLSSGESKWNQQQSCVVALPHGYDGKGSEHSSGRIERFLQMCNESVQSPVYSRAERAHRVNWEIVYPSTPAQYFHLLRRHLKRDFRKCLVFFFSKQYLRAPNTSQLDELLSGEFQPVIRDDKVAPAQARRVVFCTGQIYHTLNKYRETLYKNDGENKNYDVALIRIEELAPFPVAEVQQLLEEYNNAELMWAQEEPKNMGAWSYVEERFDYYTNGERPLMYAGRSISATTATAYKSLHDMEQENICSAVFA